MMINSVSDALASIFLLASRCLVGCENPSFITNLTIRFRNHCAMAAEQQVAQAAMKAAVSNDDWRAKRLSFAQRNPRNCPALSYWNTMESTPSSRHLRSG
ncbi:uncharacterized protein B0T15DRAFT_134057 [Chaetomium strumarium]|uniref:Secreted protein n=1 Tax=Chaetomium strumarium TaxID=1170767 RepID=A0AAJ0GZV1_9PEZI|nr:hypothetical protein B0T15DRAFT_134057 [Chaetomium strumarium]